MKKLIALVALAATVIAAPALAHESPAKHGGIVRSAGDISFEMVNKDGVTTIYVDDHGKEVAMAGASGTLTILKGSEKSEIPLAAGTGNTLVAQSGDKIASGAKVIAAITFPNKSVKSIRFSIK